MDEPTTALDVAMQREIVRRIVQLRDQFGFAVIFIAHDMSLLLEIAERIAIMYAGKIAAIGNLFDIHRVSNHPLRGTVGECFRARVIAQIPLDFVVVQPRGYRHRPLFSYAYISKIRRTTFASSSSTSSSVNLLPLSTRLYLKGTCPPFQ